MNFKTNTFKIIDLTNLERVELKAILSPDVIEFEEPSSSGEFSQFSDKLKATVVISLASLQVLSSYLNKNRSCIKVEKKTPHGQQVEVIDICYSHGNEDETLKKLIALFEIELGEDLTKLPPGGI